MTKKDYQAIARALHGTMLREDATSQWCADVDAMSDVLAADNPRFDRERFREACETGRCKGMPAIPACARVMGCLCAKHARGAKASASCDARE